MSHCHIKSSHSLKRQVRIILLLDAADLAGISPIPVIHLHAFAYLANVLAPVWNLEPLEGKILKRRGGPFYPELQADIDSLIGMGMVRVSEATYIKDEIRWRIGGKYHINRDFCKKLLRCINLFDDEQNNRVFITELAYALSAIDTSEFDKAMLEDATFSDPITGEDNVIDFAEWKYFNISKNAANTFSNFTVEKEYTSPGKKIHLYIRHLYRRVHAG